MRNKIINSIKGILMVMLTLLSVSVMAENKKNTDSVKPTGVYAICKTANVNNYTSDEGCHQYYTKGKLLCSDSKGNICTSTSREDLCIKTGKAVGIAFNAWSSGWGTFDSLASCLEKCGRDSVVKFGGKCHELVIK